MGFLGAGSIIQSRGRVEGLTTAAAMWVVAGIGAATGLGSYTIAIVTTALTLISLRGLGIIANLIAPERARLSEEDDRDSTP
jgi:putative Mg2+ transporter-C (MgtC) family protein